MNAKYTIESLGYNFYDGNIIVRWANEVSLVFDTTVKEWILLKHGTTENVQYCADRWIYMCTLANLKDHADKILIITGKFPLDELNKVISIPSYGKTFYNKMKEEGWI